MPQTPPDVVPPIAEPTEPDVLATVPGVSGSGVGAVGGPVSVPIVAAPPIAVTPPGVAAAPPPIGAGGPTPGAGAGGTLPAAPRQASAAPPPARQPLPATVGSNAAVPASSYRVGYGEYLRTAGIPQVAVMAVSGVLGMLVLTGAGGLVGYRQAKAGRAVRTSGIAKYMK